QRLLELIRAKLDRDAELKVLKLEIEVSAGTVSLGGNTQSKKQVELAVALANEVPGVTKVVAKTRPASIQRHRPKTFDAAAEEAGLPPEAAHKPKRKLFGIIPLGGDSKTPQPVAVTSRNYRETLKKTLQKRCGDQLKDLSIKASADGKGLLIEGKVANPSVRRACFKQIDNLVELRSVSYDFVLQITDPE
ncbi:MAG TPA: BON domain-containing protein, partial [Planctomycetia bacterium]|nr:BON domain-containing protein [Planctomycetia bacterium]